MWSSLRQTRHLLRRQPAQWGPHGGSRTMAMGLQGTAWAWRLSQEKMKNNPFWVGNCTVAGETFCLSHSSAFSRTYWILCKCSLTNGKLQLLSRGIWGLNTSELLKEGESICTCQQFNRESGPWQGLVNVPINPTILIGDIASKLLGGDVQNALKRDIYQPLFEQGNNHENHIKS